MNKVGQKVMIYSDPEKQTRPEGKATLVGLLQDAGRNLELWEVKFEGTIESCSRLVRKDKR